MMIDGKILSCRQSNLIVKINEDELCYICNQEATKNAINTHDIKVCPDCIKRIVRNHISDLMNKLNIGE